MEHIESERAQPGENLEEIESRFKDATDPRAWFERNPALCLGAAAASGVVLGLLLTSRSSDEFSGAGFVPTEPSERHPAPENRHLKTIKNTLDTTVAALVGLGARKFQDFVSDTLPGFQEQYYAASRQQPEHDSYVEPPLK